MTGPQDPAAAGGDRLRAGHADREQVIETLKDAFAQGRRPGANSTRERARRSSARTCADLAVLTADIPAAAGAGGAPARPGPPVAAARAAAGSGGCLIIAAAAVLARRPRRSGHPGPHSRSFLGSPVRFS